MRRKLELQQIEDFFYGFESKKEFNIYMPHNNFMKILQFYKTKSKQSKPSGA